LLVSILITRLEVMALASVLGSRHGLAAAVDGPVLLPGDDGYAEEVATVNLSVRHRPAVVVGATGASDIQAVVRFAAEHELPVAVLLTGHGPSVSIDSRVLVNTRRMRGVTIDPVARTARAEAGVCWQQVVDEAAKAGLAPLTGSSSTVGVVGYTLGGGISATMGRAFGWAVDHVRRIDVVTADGRLHHVTPDSEPDLFWALCGGKSNFGVVTAMEFALFPVTRLYAGNLFYSGEHTREVLRAYQTFAAQAPDDLTSSIVLLRMPDLAFIPEFMRGKLTVNIRISYLGSKHEGEELIALLRAVAPVLLDTVADIPYADSAAMFPDSGEPAAAVEHFALLTAMTPATADAITEVAGPGADSRISIIDVRQMGGALAGTTGNRNAVGNRDAAFVVFALTFVPPGEVAGSETSGLELMDALRPWISPRKHPSFLSPADAAVEETRKAFDDPTYQRLRSIKAEYDPTNMFRFNHNIPPGPTASS
jgi:FAD/FMN-containing dehydrogenase